KQLILDVPIELSGSSPTLTDVETADSGYLLGLGAAYRFFKSTTVGLSLVRTSERHKTWLYTVDADNPFIQSDTQGAFNQFALGVRCEMVDHLLVLAATYKTAVAKKYTGHLTSSLTGTEVSADIDAADYQPAEIGIAAEGSLGAFGLFGDFTLDQWAAGKD